MRSRTTRKKRAVTLALGASLLAAACGGSTATTTESTSAGASSSEASESSSSESDTSTGNPLLTGSIGTVAGDQFDLASLEGQDAVLWFWAPW